MKVREHLPLAELERLEREEKNAQRARRLRIVILALKGYTAPAVAMSLGLSRRVCQAWVYRYNDHGLKGLEDQRGKSPRVTLISEQQSQVCQRLEQGPTPEDGVCSLRGVDIQRLLAEEFGVLRSLSAVYYLLHQLGYSYLRPRPQHCKFNARPSWSFSIDCQRRCGGLLSGLSAKSC